MYDKLLVCLSAHPHAQATAFPAAGGQDPTQSGNCQINKPDLQERLNSTDGKSAAFDGSLG